MRSCSIKITHAATAFGHHVQRLSFFISIPAFILQIHIEELENYKTYLMELEKGKETIEMDMRDIRAFHAWLGANQKFCDTNQKIF